MGYGDDVMATAYARMAREKNPTAKVVFGNPETFFDAETKKFDVHWSEVFEHNPNIYQPRENIADVVCVPDYHGFRSYFDYARCEPRDGPPGQPITKFAFHADFRAPKGDFYFSDGEIAEADRLVERLPPDFIFLEPAVSGTFNTNKAWPEERWAELAARLAADFGIVQLAKTEDGLWMDKLPGAEGIVGAVTPTFRSTCAVLRRARLFIGTDGGLHHASAALDVPAVVLWSGFTSPKHLGYDAHVNLAHFDLDHPSGERAESAWCRENMEKITVDEVVVAVGRAMG